jgi:hypothetical protein
MNTSVDGPRRSVAIVFPAKVHCFAGALIISLGVVAYYARPALEPAVWILGILTAYYSAFYARVAIRTSRETERRLETIKFSRLYSDAPTGTARDAIVVRFNKFLEKETGPNDKSRRAAAIAKLSQEMKDSLHRRQTTQPTQSAQPSEVTLSNLDLHGLTMLDFFEDLAVGIEDGVYDEVTAQKLLGTALVAYWELLSGLAHLYRAERSDNTLYEAMEKISKRWNS